MISKEICLVVEAHSKSHKGTDTEYQLSHTDNKYHPISEGSEKVTGRWGMESAQERQNLPLVLKINQCESTWMI